MDHRERLKLCLNNELPDRSPVALWRHFPVDDQHPDTLAEATLSFQKTYDFDFVKVTPASSFSIKDWGALDKWNGNPEGTRDYIDRVIKKPHDWETLVELEPNSSKYLSAQLECLSLIKKNLPADTPLIQTIFSPLAQAKNLAGNETLIAHLRLYPEEVMKGLEIITRSTIRFMQAVVETGVDGIFYAIQHAQGRLLTRAEYKDFGLPNDLKVLEPANSLWLNVLHLHGTNVYFDLVNEYKFQVVNWHDRETSPTLSEAEAMFGGARCGGLRQETLVFEDQAWVRKEAQDALEQTNGKRFILGTGCVVPVMASHGNLMAARKAVESK